MTKGQQIAGTCHDCEATFCDHINEALDGIEAHRDHLQAQLSALRKLVEAQGKVVEAARKYEKLHAAAQAGFFYRAVSIADTMIAQMELFDELRQLDALLLALKETEEKSP